MIEPQFSRRIYQRELSAYQGLPVASAVILVCVFLAVFLMRGSYLLSSLAAALPSVFLMWRWIIAGRRIDRWGCPNCEKPFPRKCLGLILPLYVPVVGSPRESDLSHRNPVVR